MSVDVVDDIESGEDRAGEFAETLHDLVLAWDHYLATGAQRSYLNGVADVVEIARKQVDAWRAYCRPTCGFLDTGECADGETCGCPCEHEATDG